MVKRKMYQEIKKLQKLGFSKRQISLKLQMDKKTVRKYCSMDDVQFGEYLKKHRYRNKEFDNLKADILDLYRENDNIKLPVSAVYDYLEEIVGALPANENSLRNYIKFLEATGKIIFNNKERNYSKVKELPYGKQLQIDFGEEKKPLGGKYYIFGAVLSASRFKYAALQDRPFTALDLIGHLLDCFDYIHGLPEELVIDQDSIMVVDENKGDIIYTKVFGDFIKEMDLEMRVCRKSDPESKGKIENFVKYIKYNFFAFRRFENLSEARESLLKWLIRRANGKISQATKKIPLIEIETERIHLRKLKNSIYRKDQCSMREERVANEKNRISVDSCHYEIPSGYKNRIVEIYKTDTRLFVYDRHTGEEIASHSLSLIPGQLVKNKVVLRDMSKKASDLKKEVADYFSYTGWKRFLDFNFKTFSRYVRDQCLEAKKYFKDKDINAESFKTALDYCMENQTYSMANLNDSYIYFLKKDTERSTPVVNISDRKSRIDMPGINVSKPDLSPYRDVLKKNGGQQQ
ncbi:DDE-type integrase/transposase/recombinase [Candidatus Woesearchaeota archaeon]|nr:DDE-type integrase/transposase/recombinase [Candidatus Woesearchaeota archaeon]